MPTRARSDGARSSASTFCCGINTMRSPASARLIASTETARFTDSGAAVRGNTTVRRSGSTGSSDGIWGGGEVDSVRHRCPAVLDLQTRGRRSIGDAPGCFEVSRATRTYRSLSCPRRLRECGSRGAAPSSRKARGCHARGTTTDRFDATGCRSRRRRTCGHRRRARTFASRTASVRSGLCDARAGAARWRCLWPSSSGVP